MKVCPVCREVYSADHTKCVRDDAVLVDEDQQLSMSDTLTSSAVMSGAGPRNSGAGGPGVAAAPTPAPVVRSQPGAESLPPRVGSDSIVGTSLAGRYEVTRKIGEGGMGVVYEGRHSLIGKRVAIKVLLDKYAQKADIVARLQQEARLASSIGHEHIVDITDFGETADGRTFVVMEFLEGESLAQLLSREGPLPPMRAVAIARQTASALGAAHGKGIVHRDVKPENVFITRRNDRDFVKVVDFGISKAMRASDETSASSSPRLTHTGMVLGTPLYMSPEQARGEDDLDHRIDVYAIGVILYELITGEVPFRGTNYLSIISQVLSQDPKAPSKVRPDLEVTPALEAVIMRAMAKDRSVRYQAMSELDSDLARLEHGDAVLAASSSPGASLGPEPRRRRRLLSIAWVAGIAAIVLGTAAAVRPILGKKKAEAVASASPTDAPDIKPTPPEDMAFVFAEVTSNPSGAEIWWGSQSMGTTPTKLKFPKSKEQIELTLKLDGYQDGTLSFYPDGDKNVPAELQKAELVKIKIVSKTAGEVFIDGKSVGKVTPQKPLVIEIMKGKAVPISIMAKGKEIYADTLVYEKDDILTVTVGTARKVPPGNNAVTDPKEPPCDDGPTNPDLPPNPLKKPCKK